MASIEFHRPGWLDKVVQYRKNKLFEDFRKVPAVQIEAKIQLAPEGYVDSPAWDFESVTRLLVLIQGSDKSLPVRRALRRMLGNTRRKMSIQESVKVFPSLTGGILNDIYYDTYSGEMYGDVVTEVGFINNLDQGVIIVSNPVEARLPSAMISINLLRNILEERAKAARYMPTSRKTIPWKPITKTSLSVTPANNTTKQEVGTTTSILNPEEKNHTDSTGNTGPPGTGTAAGNPTTAAAAA